MVIVMVDNAGGDLSTARLKQERWMSSVIFSQEIDNLSEGAWPRVIWVKTKKRSDTRSK